VVGLSSVYLVGALATGDAILNRRDRRRTAKLTGRDWRDEAPIRRLEANSARLEAACLRLPPEKARELLARWAGQAGRPQEEIDRLNGRGGHGMVQ
jgi:hypothetical protein